MSTPTRILFNATAVHGGTQRTLPISAEFLADGTPVTAAGEVRRDIFPLSGLEAISGVSAAAPLPEFPIAEVQAAQQAGDFAKMQQLQADYTTAVQAQKATQSVTDPRHVVAHALARWLADTQQVYTTPGSHYVLDFATLQCTEFDRNGESVMAFAPAAVFGQ